MTKKILIQTKEDIHLLLAKRSTKTKKAMTKKIKKSSSSYATIIRPPA